jgi:hypothetical protein
MQHLSGLGTLGCLGKVGAHVALEIEVGELISIIELEKLGEVGIRVNLATILLVLEIVLADVSVNLTGNLSASHLSTRCLSKERGKLRGNESRLYETTWGAVARFAAALSRCLVGNLELTRRTLLKLTELSLKRREHGGDLLKLTEKISKCSRESSLRKGLSLSLGISSLSRNSGSSNGSNNRGSRGGGSSLGLLLSLGGGSSSNSLRSSSGNLGGSRLCGDYGATVSVSVDFLELIRGILLYTTIVFLF